MRKNIRFLYRNIKSQEFLQFTKIITDNNLCFKAYTSFGKNEIIGRITVFVDLLKPVWNDDMFH